VLKHSAALFFISFIATGVLAQDQKPDPWQTVRFLAGNWKARFQANLLWHGSRSYEFILHDNFIQEMNTSTYPPQEQTRPVRHITLALSRYDSTRKTLMLRQFHEEGFVNLYALNKTASGSKLLVFESESFENFDNSWKAKENYEIISNQEFIETFELAPPGKAFEVYSRNHFKRVP
jgi:hypothetical protein